MAPDSSATVTLTRQFASAVEPTENVKQVASWFGIGIDRSIEIVLYRDLDITLAPGRVIYCTGESGAGKSTLMRDIVAAARDRGHRIVEMPDVSKMSDAQLVDQFGDMPLESVLSLLSKVGISEPFVFLRKPAELSDGQRYRFVLGKMIEAAQRDGDGGGFPIVPIDEFSALLDRETARNLAYQVRRAATKHGLCFVLASTHRDIIEDLQPDTTVTMRLNTKPEVRT